MDESSPTVALRPPVDFMRPRPADEIPAQGSTPGGLQYSLKLDGFRALAFILEDGKVFLQSRSRRDLSREFPEIAAYLRDHLPPGIVLDGELCAYRDGRLNFTDLLRSHSDRKLSGVPVSYIAFDILAVPGRDVRALPLRERWELLGAALQDVGPPLQRVLATLDEETAHVWFRDMRAVGVEGIVAKALSSPYRAGGTWAWRKIRHSDTRDGMIIGVFGPVERPHGVLVELSDGRTVKTSPRLTGMQARQVGESVHGLLGVRTEHPDHGIVTVVIEPVLVEVRETAGRHETAKFVRVRFEG
ncbi:ATP-dependent DNA ligase [Streptomyces lunaelactis]|uniref:ATP-dependent DNA ligase n=1 Tax=Streptomyces lunaelactis TaxID=1535768 RepID=UPI0020C8053B|nr:DNA ligase [Streptomyces lunaelactis]